MCHVGTGTVPSDGTMVIKNNQTCAEQPDGSGRSSSRLRNHPAAEAAISWAWNRWNLFLCLSFFLSFFLKEVMNLSIGWSGRSCRCRRNDGNQKTPDHAAFSAVSIGMIKCRFSFFYLCFSLSLSSSLGLDATIVGFSWFDLNQSWQYQPLI